MNAKPIVLTLGEPAGVGGEIALKSWQILRKELSFFLLADIGHMTTLSHDLGVPIIQIDDPSQTTTKALSVMDHTLSTNVVAGIPDAKNAPHVVEMIERAVGMVQNRQACALTTNPIHKKALKDGTTFPFPGHTEFLAHLGGINRPVMMLAAPELKVVPVTIHIALNAVSKTLTPALLGETIRITHSSLITDFGILAPRIAVAGLNPHAGEDGLMGHEEEDIIAPVLNILRADGLNLIGPMSADTMFHSNARETYDLAICMYHDQALIPIKTLNFSHGVNVTLGLPFVRTSPDHGTAFDIAGQGVADPSSLVEALRTAWKIAGNRGTR